MHSSEHSHVKVSVVTVVYNAVDTIESTLLSVLMQDYDNVEYVVIDGGSTDGTLEIIDRYRERISYMVSERDGGIYEAMNKGVRAATGKWIGVMNAGDVFSSDDVLSRIFAGDEDYEGVDVIYGGATGRDARRTVVQPGTDRIDDLAVCPAYRHGASFVRRETHLKFEFDLSKKAKIEFALDYEQIYRMYRAGCRFIKVPIMIMDYAIDGASNAPFRGAYYNYLITHEMRGGWFVAVYLSIKVLVDYAIKKILMKKQAQSEVAA